MLILKSRIRYFGYLVGERGKELLVRIFDFNFIFVIGCVVWGSLFNFFC